MCNKLKIGNVELRNNLVAAPMAGVTDASFRYLAAKMGAGLTVTEMATSRGIIQRHKRTLGIIGTHPEARPYSAQLFGEVPDILAQAAGITQEIGADIVDLNAACPVRKITRSGSGAQLLNDVPLLARILAAMRKSIDVPLTVKLRSGWDSHSIIAVEVAKVAQEEGVDAITLHPRTASQGFEGQANWSYIGEVAASVDIPVIGSGDVRSHTDALEMLKQTGCAAVMIGRASIGNPFIFRETAAALEGKAIPPVADNSEKCRVALEHFDLMREWHDPKTAVVLWRKHLCRYARGMRDATELRRNVFSIWDVDRLKDMTLEFFGPKDETTAIQGSAT